MAAHGVLNLSTWKQPHPVLAAVQHIRTMRGGSQAHLLAASDGNLYITKFQNNPQHVRILASEFLATRLVLNLDRKSTRLNSSHVAISYAVFCSKKKQKKRNIT